MESEVGIELFYTDIPGIGGRLKKYPEDFQLWEEIELENFKGGDHSLAKIWSRNWETNRLVSALSRQLGINRDRIDFAGTKDKRAITAQWMSFPVGPSELSNIDINDVEIKDIKEGYNSLYLGAHRSNRFDVIIRDIEMDKGKTIERVEEIGSVLKKKRGFPNWFGVQRFGTIRPITHLVGKHIVQGEFEKAVKCYITYPAEDEGERCYEARRFLEETWDYDEALKRFPDYLTYEKKIIRSLIDRPDDYITALKGLPENLLRMFVHAYQSYLFNQMISSRSKKGMKIKDAYVGDVLLPARRDGSPNVDTPVEINERNLSKGSDMVKAGKAFVSAPLFGFSSNLSSGEQGEIEREVIEEEGLQKRDFVIPEISELSSKGSRRAIFAPCMDLDWNWESGGVRTRFTLFKGTYATTLMREFMKLPDGEESRYS